MRTIEIVISEGAEKSKVINQLHDSLSANTVLAFNQTIQIKLVEDCIHNFFKHLAHGNSPSTTINMHRSFTVGEQSIIVKLNHPPQIKSMQRFINWISFWK